MGPAAMLKSLLVLTVLLSSSIVGVAEARDQIRVVGSSTVYPFTTTVAERLGRTTSFRTPVVESTGTGGGFKLFCSGIGVQYPDITNASRHITRSEQADCAKNGVKDIVEVKIGYDGIVIANSKAAPLLKLTVDQMWMALAKTVVANGKAIANPNVNWSDIDKSLPATRIEVLGPPPTSGTRDAFVELVMAPGCARTSGTVEAGITGAKCHEMREDGVYVEVGENDTLILRKLEENTNALGIFGYSFLDQNSDRVQGSLIGGEAPTFENIAAGKYEVSRPLYLYVKKAHVGTIPGIEAFIKEFTSAKAWGDDGYLTDKGLIPLPLEEREKIGDAARGLAVLEM
jgi:phosphate transport system substrate-binding protein